MLDRFVTFMNEKYSKKFVALLIGVIIWWMKEAGMDVEPETVVSVLLFIGSYIGFQAVADFSPRYNKKDQ